jgi:GT2 family glycosyltransferase
MISVIIVQHGKGDLTARAITTLRQQTTYPHEIIVVDNASPDDSADRVVRECPGISIIRRDVNLGFGAANNAGVRDAKGELLLFLNNDTECIEDSLTSVAARFAADPGLGVLGPRLVNRDRSFQLSAGPLPSFLTEIGDKILHNSVDRGIPGARALAASSFRRERRVGWVTGAALFVRRSLFDGIGGFDERFFMYFEDKDLCSRAADAGAAVVHCPTPVIVHLRGGSTTGGQAARLAGAYRASQRLYYIKHRPALEQRLLDLYLRINPVPSYAGTPPQSTPDY